jgi:hydroxymethylbilane synthase
VIADWDAWVAAGAVAGAACGGLLRGRGDEVEIEVIKTTGDRLQEVTLLRWVRRACLRWRLKRRWRGAVDLAVHSLKDLPTELPEGFVLAAAAPGRCAGCVCFAGYASLQDCLRERGWGRAVCGGVRSCGRSRPDLEYVEFRGNVDTRLRKLGEGQAEAILLAAAGLDRLEKTEWVRERLEPEVICPAAGQGALGIEIRAHDARVRRCGVFG